MKDFNFSRSKFSYILASVLSWILVLVIIGACSSQPSENKIKHLFNRNVESCICRYLVIETDNYSRLEYSDFVESCNETVRESNAERYSTSLEYSPRLHELRCEEDVKAWQEVIDENKQFQENNRQFIEKLRGKQE